MKDQQYIELSTISKMTSISSQMKELWQRYNVDDDEFMNTQ